MTDTLIISPTHAVGIRLRRDLYPSTVKRRSTFAPVLSVHTNLAPAGNPRVIRGTYSTPRAVPARDFTPGNIIPLRYMLLFLNIFLYPLRR
jgi:hypothetical protein